MVHILESSSRRRDFASHITPDRVNGTSYRAHEQMYGSRTRLNCVGSGCLDVSNLDGAGADWLEQYKPFINDGQNVVCSPHKVFRPESNDLVLQLRKRGIDQVVLAGMSANLCVESHLRELLEHGFEVAVVGDATAAAQVPDYDDYAAAITNFRFLASDLWSTDEAIQRLSETRTISPRRFESAVRPEPVADR